MMEVTLTEPQQDMWDLTCVYPLFVAGYGTGKSFTLITCALRDLIENPGANIAIYSPSYDLNRLNLVPRFTEAMQLIGLQFSYNKSDMIMVVKDLGCIIFRSMVNPERIISYEVFASHVDELDTLPLAKAEDVWNKIIARNRQKIVDEEGNTKPNRVSAYSTPEGFNFTYKRWKESPTAEYQYVTASTRSNPHLPESYISNLYDSYPSALVDAYIDGLWVNMTSGSVYKSYERNKCDSTELVKGNEPLIIGMDFNVQRGCSVVYVRRYDEEGREVMHAVDEIHNAFDTPEQISILQERYPNNPKMVIPDASGDNRKSSNATETDFTQLKAAKFRIKHNNRNPLIKERLMSMNSCFEKGLVKVNSEMCPNFVTALEQQVYDKNGQPDKSPPNYDDINDAAGYPVCYLHPIKKQSAKGCTTVGAY